MPTESAGVMPRERREDGRVQITFLGTGQAYLDGERAGASIFVEHDGSGLLLDCGPGSLGRAEQSGIGLERIQAVLLSHLHFDHAMGVAELLTRMAFQDIPPPLFAGPSRTGDYMRDATEFARTQMRFLVDGLWLHRLDDVGVTEMPAGGEIVVGTLRAHSITVPHTDDLHALAWRVEAGGHSFVYSGDIGPADGVLEPFASGAEVLIHECYSDAALTAQSNGMSDERARAVRGAFEHTHTTVEAAARVAADAAVGTLVLTHLLPTESDDRLIKEAGRWFGGAVVVARDGYSFEL